MTDARVLAKKFADLLLKSGIPLNHLLLYGSYARGTATADSDIDVCVVSPNFGHDYFAEMVKLRLLSLTVDSRIEPIAFSPDDLKDKFSTLAAEINRFGIRIV